MRKILFIICLLLICSCTSASQLESSKMPVIDPLMEETTNIIRWRKYTHKRLALARMTKKPVVILFIRYNCPACIKFSIKTLQAKGIVDKINDSFEPLIVRNTDDRFSNLATLFHVNVYPTIFVIDTKGNAIQLKGLVDPETLSLFLMKAELGI